MAGEKIKRLIGSRVEEGASSALRGQALNGDGKLCAHGCKLLVLGYIPGQEDNAIVAGSDKSAIEGVSFGAIVARAAYRYGQKRATVGKETARRARDGRLNLSLSKSIVMIFHYSV